MSAMTIRSPDSWQSLAPPRFATPRSPNRQTRGVQIGRVGDALGHPLMPHQRLIADVGGEVLADGSPAFREVIFTLMRQQGKTTLFLVWSVERCTLRSIPQRVAYTAQSGSDARKKLLDDQVPILQASPLFQAVRRVSRAQGSEGVVWKNGSRIDVLASSVSAGHGKIVDLGEIDEAFDEVDDRREQSLLPAMITRPDAQLLIGSTMGTDAAVYLNRKVTVGRAAALEGKTSGIAYFEWSIPEDENVDDPRVWWQYMPALGFTIREEEVAHARQTMTDGEWRRAFGNQMSRSAERVIPEVAWRAACRPTVTPMGSGGVVFVVEVSPDREWAGIVAAAVVDGVSVCEVVEYRTGTGWLASRCDELRGSHGGRVVVEARSPAAACGIVGVEELSTADAVKASGAFYDGIADGRVLVRSDPRLDRALEVAVKQPVGETWRFGRRPGGDASLLVALTLATFVASTMPAPEFFVF